MGGEARGGSGLSREGFEDMLEASLRWVEGEVALVARVEPVLLHVCRPGLGFGCPRRGAASPWGCLRLLLYGIGGGLALDGTREVCGSPGAPRVGGLRDLGALKSWTTVPRSTQSGWNEVWRERGSTSGAFWLAFLLVSRVDMGFFKNGRPFFPRAGSVGGAAAALGYGSTALGGGALPVGLTPARRSVGATKDDDGLFNAGMLELADKADGCRPAGCCVSEVGASDGSWRRAASSRYLARATPPMKPVP